MLGIEARADSVARCNYVLQETGLPNLRFVADDARNLDSYGSFEIVLCLGLLYHLDAPIAFLHQLGRATERLLVVQTHYAEERRNRRYPLGALTTNEGVPGRWYWETRRAGLRKLVDRATRGFSRQRPKAEWSSRQQMDSAVWGSWDNPASFWPLKSHLLKAIQTDGRFDVVYEQLDALEDIANDPRSRRDSSAMFIALRTP